MDYLINKPTSIEDIDFKHVNDDLPRFGKDFDYNNEESKWCTYIHINKTNRKIYVGISSNLTKRWAGNGSAYKNCKRFYNAIKCYGWHNFEHIVLMNGLTKSMAKEVEIQLIQKLDTYYINGHGYNGTLGGDLVDNNDTASLTIYQYDLNGIFIQSFDSIAEANDQFATKNKGRIYEASNLYPPFAYGFLWSRTYYDQIESYYPNDYRYLDEYHFPTEYTQLGKIVELSKTGELIKIHSSICKISMNIHIINAILKCCKNEKEDHIYNQHIWMFYKDYNQDSINNILQIINNPKQLVRRGAVIAYDLDGNYLKKFNNIYEAERELNVDYSNISKVCRGKKPYAKNYQFRFEGDPNPGKYIKHRNPIKLKVPYRIAQIDIETNNIIGIYNNYSEIEKALNLNKHANCIKTSLDGKTKTSIGFIWRYIDNDNNIIEPKYSKK